ncbi:hypothetical protein CEXT_736381 [Caerostris extrusa]|uniref:Uncharacterized protein n=1 Tax=Caerostris extrusa TaxID=172846 RepID=A0AAV4NJW7_CAEEX|nr:hypothetical protein CEXT_736381 [Caerostris extrusa]
MDFPGKQPKCTKTRRRKHFRRNAKWFSGFRHLIPWSLFFVGGKYTYPTTLIDTLQKYLYIHIEINIPKESFAMGQVHRGLHQMVHRGLYQWYQMVHRGFASNVHRGLYQWYQMVHRGLYIKWSIEVCINGINGIKWYIKWSIEKRIGTSECTSTNIKNGQKTLTCSRGGSLGRTRASPWVGFRRRPPKGPGGRRRSSTGRGEGPPCKHLVWGPRLGSAVARSGVIIRLSAGLSQISCFFTSQFQFRLSGTNLLTYSTHRNVFCAGPNRLLFVFDRRGGERRGGAVSRGAGGDDASGGGAGVPVDAAAPMGVDALFTFSRDLRDLPLYPVGGRGGVRRVSKGAQRDSGEMVHSSRSSGPER